MEEKSKDRFVTIRISWKRDHGTYFEDSRIVETNKTNGEIATAFDAFEKNITE